MTLYTKLLQREKDGHPTRVGVIGAGQMSFGMISQIPTISGMIVSGISDTNLEAANHAAEACKAGSVLKHDTLISPDFKDVINSDRVEIIVDATGVPEAGAQISLGLLMARKHIVLLNVEIDITVGPLMNKMYRATDLVYTGSDGDEPAATMQMYEFAKSMGMEVLIVGKGKNNKLIVHAGPDTATEKAKKQVMNSKILASFQDGTETMEEVNLLSNAMGFIPDVIGTHGIPAGLDGTASKLDLRENGRVLSGFGVVGYVDGIAPGIFCIVKGQNEDVTHGINYLIEKGNRDHRILYRPFHLCSLGTPITIAHTVLEQDTAILPMGVLVSETVRVTKEDIKAGERADGTGGFCIRDVLKAHGDMVANASVPIGLTAGAITKHNIKDGAFLTIEDVELDESTTVYKPRKL